MHPKLRNLIRSMLDDGRAASPSATPALCSTCRHWHRWPDAQQQLHDHANGSCRRRSPGLFVIGAQAKTKWPATFTDDTCGEHRPRS